MGELLIFANEVIIDVTTTISGEKVHNYYFSSKSFLPKSYVFFIFYAKTSSSRCVVLLNDVRGRGDTRYLLALFQQMPLSACYHLLLPCDICFLLCKRNNAFKARFL